MLRFGKSSKPLLEARGHLLEVDGNRRMVARSARIYECYRQQPRRDHCKLCDEPLVEPPMFEKFNIPYYLCSCGHLSGGFEDTAEFNALLYATDGGLAAADYSDETKKAFCRRIADIYVPKVEFLFDALREANEDPTTLRYADLGGGSGFFVAALDRAGAGAVAGWDVSDKQVDLANRMIGKPLMQLHGLNELEGLVTGVEADVVSMIFVLEHVSEPRKLMHALRRNAHVKYLFVSVPTISPSMCLELAFPTVFERHLSAHTHLFSESSLKWLAKDCGFEICAEWWFGGDAMDLFRSVVVRMREDGHSESIVSAWRDMMQPAIDEWQLALDRRRLASEVHVVLRKTQPVM